MGEWQDIASAPRDVEFLAFVPMWQRTFQVRMWDADRDPETVCEPTKGRLFAASHWQPLPEPPHLSRCNETGREG